MVSSIGYLFPLGFLGAELCLAVEQTLGLLRQWWGSQRRGGEWTPQQVQLLQRVGVQLLFVGQSLSYMLSEHRSLTSGGSLAVNHGGHLVGCLTGAACYALMRALGCERGPPCPWRRAWPRFPWPWGGGRQAAAGRGRRLGSS